MCSFFYITAEGLYYGGRMRSLRLEDALLFLSNILCHRSVAATFNALSQGVDIKWKLRDQPIWPFGDARQGSIGVYTFDLDVDILYYSDRHRNLQIPLARFREPGTPPTLGHFTAFKPSSAPKLNLLAFQSASWKPAIPVPPRVNPLVPRIMADFGDQWRHILRWPYNDSTFRKFARSVIDLAQLDFRTVEEASRRKHHSGKLGAYVELYNVPTWTPYDKHVIRIGTATLVLDQDLQKAMEITRNLIAKPCEDKGKGRSIYILLSIRHIMLCQEDVHHPGEILYTSPAALLDGINPPSSASINLLLQGLSEAFPRPELTLLHKLPVEIQVRILEYVSEGRIESARLGCVLGLGLPFNWMRKDVTRKEGPIEVTICPRNRSCLTPVETKIYFGDTFTGLSYR